MVEFDVVCIGNCLVDAVTRRTDLLPSGTVPGSMTLVGSEITAAILFAADDVAYVPGGSASNTAAVVASLGGRSAVLGMIGRDAPGEAFVAGANEIGVAFLGAIDEVAATGTCLAMVDGTGERTMLTALGAALGYPSSEPDLAAAAEARVVFAETYLLDVENGGDLVTRAFMAARGRCVLTLSDPACVLRNATVIRMLIDVGFVDVLIGNEAEFRALLGADGPIEDELLELAGRVPHVVCTMGARGALEITQPPGEDNGDLMVRTVAASDATVVDLVGAGDAFAAGWCLGLARNATADRRLALGARAAAALVETIGARPSASLTHLASFGDGVPA